MLFPIHFLAETAMSHCTQYSSNEGLVYLKPLAKWKTPARLIF